MIRTAIIEDDPEIVAKIESAIIATSDVCLNAVARNAAEGSLLVERGHFDVLLCDLGLPDGSGIDLIRKAATLHPDSDIIVITMFADQRKVLDSIRAGARGYLLKDHGLDECVESIREIRRGGSPISPIIARQLLKRLQPAGGGAGSPSETLSKREMELLGLLARGFSYSECAGLMAISQATIGTYVKRLYRKLEVSSRSEAVFEASSRGIFDGH